MGFFKNLFKRKPGGTFFGNALRGVANQATGGILGSGAGLARWEAKEYEQQYNQAAIANTNAQLQNNAAFKAGSSVGNAAKDAAPDDPEAKSFIKKTLVMKFLKKHWWKILLPVIGIPLIIVAVRRRKKDNR